MKEADYFSAFLENDKEEKRKLGPKLPKWVSPDNSSLVLYNAIQKLFKDKRHFIRSHNKKTDYKNKSRYQISKSDVAATAKVTMQPVFYSVSYSTDLMKELNNKNEILLQAKEKVLSEKYSSMQALSKAGLLAVVKDQKSEIVTLNESIVEEIYEKSLEKMPLSLKRAFKLI